MADKKKAGIGRQESDWSKTGTCLNRPHEGWLHMPGELEKDAGVCYVVRYVGCLDVVVSMKSLSFEMRTAVARESISIVANAAGLQTNMKKKRDKKILRHLGEQPNLSNAGIDVTLIITTDHLKMISMDTNQTLLVHNMEEISFASGGDSETVNFIAYVAKDSTSNRACHVLECSGGMASDVIVTIAQAFELRYKEMLKKKKQPVVVPDREVHVADESAWGDDDPTYYNDDAELELVRRQASQHPPPIPPLPDQYSIRPSNLPVPGTPAFLTSNHHQPSSPLYENTPNNTAGAVPKQNGSKQSDPSGEIYSLSDPDQHLSPQNEPWFQGKLSRNEAERLLLSDGDFLVRESKNKAGQYVLSGMKSGIVVHLLLVDPEGVVRTKDRTFDNVSHLISYHKDNSVPILSQDIELYLSNPILR